MDFDGYLIIAVTILIILGLFSTTGGRRGPHFCEFCGGHLYWMLQRRGFDPNTGQPRTVRVKTCQAEGCVGRATWP